jgi:hypothetical protein
LDIKHLETNHANVAEIEHKEFVQAEQEERAEHLLVISANTGEELMVILNGILFYYISKLF